MKIKNGIVREFLIALMILVCVMGLIGVLTIYATEDNTEEELYEYEVLEDGTVEITGYLGNEKEIIIPEMIDGKTVTSIGNNTFSGYTELINIIIPENVTNIGDAAFSGCTNLIDVTIPEAVTNIEDFAFSNCESLTNITIPENVTRIGSSAFRECIGLENIIISEGVTDIGNYAFVGCTSLKSIEIPENITSIGDSTFYGCISLTDVKIPSTVTTIEISAFYECSSLEEINVDVNNMQYCSEDGILFNKIKTEIVKYPAGKLDATYGIPEGVTCIGAYAFHEAINLTNIEIPETVTEISGMVFEGCTGLECIEIPDGVKSIEWSTFEGCTSLMYIKIPENVVSIESSAFNKCFNLKEINVDTNNTEYCSESGILFNKSKTEIVKYPAGKLDVKYIIPEGIISIDSFAFSGCTSLTNIEIPEGVTTIGYAAFEGCTELVDVVIPQGVTGMLWGTFNGCTKLERIEIPEGVESIEVSTFQGCTSLRSVRIPYGVISLSDHVFADCTGLVDIEIPITVKSIGYAVFEGCTSIENIEIPAGVTSIGPFAFSGCSSLTNIEIPEGVISIGDCAFSDCSSLTDIEIPEGVTTIGNGAFGGCEGLINITIPSSVTSIGDWAFWGAILNMDLSENNIVDIEDPEILKRAHNIDDILYAKEIALTNCSLSEDLTKIIVTDINEEAFIEIHDGALEGLTININIQRIGENENIEFSAEEYTVIDNNIKDISPATSIATFIEKIATNGDVEIQKDGEEVTDLTVKIGTGMTLVVSTNSELREYTLVVTGDLNGDGEMGDIDLLRIARYNAGLDNGLSGAYLEAADIYKDDNKADNKDLLKLVRILVGLDSL